VDLLRGDIAMGIVRHDAETAGMNERLVPAGEPVEKRLHGAAMIAARGIDHAIGAPCLGGEDRSVVEASNDRRATVPPI
jgi:hypothetical protein